MKKHRRLKWMKPGTAMETVRRERGDSRHLLRGGRLPATCLAAWLGMMLIAVLNGALREWLYQPFVGDLAAHQISTLLLLLFLAAYFRWLTARWPMASARQAGAIGLLWFLLTLAFEFGIGLIAGRSWNQMFYDYQVAAGRIWVLIPLWVLIGPYLFFRYPGKS